MSSRVLTVMFTDIQGFTERTSTTSRESLRELLAVHEDLLLPVTARFGGRLVKTIGDALLVTFTSPTNGVLCGLEMQSTLAGWNAARDASDRITIRVALSAGEVEERDSDVFGEAVNIAARLEGVTEAGEVWFTDAVYLSMNKAEVPSSEVGHRRFKGIPEPVKVYRAIDDPHAADPAALTEALTEGLTGSVDFGDVTLPPIDQIPAARTPRAWLPWVLGGALCVAGIVAAVILWNHFDPAEKTEAEGQGHTPLPQIPDVSSRTSHELPAPQATTPPPQNTVPAPAPRPPRDPIKAEVERLETAIQRALDSGNLDEALATAVALVDKHPEIDAGRLAVRAVVGEQIREFIATKSYERALQHLDKLEGSWVWLNVADHRTDIRLAQADTLFEAMNHAGALELLEELLEKDPHNLRIARAAIERFGASYSHGSRRVAVGAAFTVARNTEGRLEALAGETLLGRYFSAGPYGTEAENARAILVARYPPSIEAAKERIADKSESTRVNAYNLLREAAQVTDEQALEHHYLSLTTLSSTSKGTLESALEWVGSRAEKPDWGALKARAALPTKMPFRIFGDFGERPGLVVDLLGAAFMPELTEEMVKIARTSDDYRRRCNAYAVLRDGGGLAALERDEFHAWVLQSFPTKSLHRCYDESVAWFAAAEGERIAGARAALTAGRATAAEKLAAYQDAAKPGWNSEHWPTRATKNLEQIDAALKSLPIP